MTDPGAIDDTFLIIQWGTRLRCKLWLAAACVLIGKPLMAASDTRFADA